MIYKTTLSLLTAAFVSSAIFAAPTSTAFITKTSYPGHVLPESALTETCEVFPNEVRITRQHGYDANRILLVERRAVRLQGDLAKVIANAKNEELVSKDNFMCDGPSTLVTAGEVKLYSTGGCGSPRLERNGWSSRKLRAIVDNYCPVTYGSDSNR